MSIFRRKVRSSPAGADRLRQWALFCLALLAADSAFAATCTSQASGNWNATATWTGCGGSGLPGANDSVVVANTHTVTLNVNSATLVAVTVNGGGTLQGDNTGKVLTVGAGSGGTMTVNGTLDFGAGTTATVTLNRNSVWAGGGTWNLSVLNVGTRALTFSAGTTATLNFSAAAAPISVSSGSITSLTTVTWNFAGAVAQTLPASANVVYGAITTNNTGGVTLGVGLTATTIRDNLTVQTGTFNNGGFSITLAAGRNFSVQGSATFNLTGTSTMVAVSGGGAKTFNSTAPCSTVNYAGANQTVTNEAYGHLTLSGSGTKTMPGSAMTVGCDFTMAGTAGATAAQAIIVNGNFDISSAGATFSAATFSHQLQGNFSRTGTFNANTSTFTFNGTANQTITGATTFNNLTLNNAAGMTLASNATVGSVMTFTSGKVTTGANKLIIGAAGSHTGSSSASYVVGTMEKTGPVGTFTYAVGDATNYTPVNTVFTSGGATGSLAANTTAGEHPDIANSGLDPALDVNRYWTLTSTGLTGTYNATFNFVSGDKDVGSDDTAYEVMRYSAGWNATTAGTRTATSTEATGLTGFGDFAIGEILPPIDHYLISHDGSMVTCLSEDITFTAHTGSHTLVDPDAGHTLSISTSTGRGTWDATPVAGGGTVTDPTPGDANNGDASYTFPGTTSSVTLRLRYTNPAADPEPVNFNVLDSSSKSETTGNALGDNDDLDLSVGSAGFVFYNSSDANAVFPTQIAGKRSDEGFGAKSLALRAVRASDSDPAVCATTFSGPITVDLGAECRNPAACAGLQVSVDRNDSGTAPVAAAIATNNDNGAALTSGYTPVALQFGANSTAELHISYPDAGQVQLHARYDLGNPAGSFMTGSSNDFVVRPFAIHAQVVGIPADPPPYDQDYTVYKAADEEFTVNVTAVGWQSGDDADADGVPDGHAPADTDPTNNAVLADNSVLSNFGQESGSGEDVTLSAVLYLPAGGSDPGLSGGTSITGFVGGAGSSATVRFAEVGFMEISAAISDSDYLGAGQVPGKSGPVGRFRAYDFNVTGNTPTFAAACNGDTTDFTYVEQPFNYATAPQVTITARSKLGTTTTNYDGVWWKLGDFTVTHAHDGGALPGGSTLDSGAASHTTVDCSAGACNGVFTSTFAGPFMYTRTTTPAAPFTSAVDMTLSNITDSDGATYAGNPFKFDNVGFNGGFNQQRWGRLVVGQAVGDPTLVLDVPVTAQYYNGTGFVQNTEDDCSTFTLASDVDLTNEDSGTQDGDQPMIIGTGTTSVTSGNGALTDGLDLMTFSAPGSDNTGIVDIALNLDTPPPPGADMPWLFYDWNGEGGFETTTAGRASFGIFSRPQTVIYSREPW